MSKRDHEAGRGLERKLREFLDCILTKAAADPAFGAQLAEIFGSESADERPEGKAEGGRDRRVFNPVLFLKQHGDAALRRELDARTDDELRAILRAQGLRRGKELKRLPRAEMLQEVAAGAEAKLKQGMIVAGRSGTEPAQQGVAADEGSGAPPPTPRS